MSDVIDALPASPLSPSDLEALAESDLFTDATPLTWTGTLVEIEPDRRLKEDVLQVALRRPDGTAYACSFDPEAGRWQLTAVEELGEHDDDAERERMVNALGLGVHGHRLREHYGDRLAGLADDARGWDDGS